MAKLENVFSWSKSRDEQFRECQRKYFYDKYASWGGWESAAGSEARTAYVLKNLKNRWAWKGETVHHVIEDVLKSLRNQQPMTLDEALGALTQTMRRDYRSSKAKKYLEDPKRHLGLFEHEYEKPVSDETWKKIHEEASTCLRNFYSTQLYRELLVDEKENWLLIEDLEDFDFEGSKVFVKLDFARRWGDTIEIYDWKTGRQDNEAPLQMGAYALYAIERWQVPISRIRAYLVNLSLGSPRPRAAVLTEELLENTRAVMRASIAEMQKLLSDPAKNIPVGRENFRFTENTRFCESCNFRKICEKYSASVL